MFQKELHANVLHQLHMRYHAILWILWCEDRRSNHYSSLYHISVSKHRTSVHDSCIEWGSVVRQRRWHGPQHTSTELVPFPCLKQRRMRGGRRFGNSAWCDQAPEQQAFIASDRHSTIKAERLSEKWAISNTTIKAEQLSEKWAISNKKAQISRLDCWIKCSGQRRIGTYKKT